MSSQAKTWLLITGAVVILLTALYLVLEWEEKRIDHGPTTEALRQPFFAMQHYLELTGVASELEGRYSWLDDQRLRFDAQDAVLLVDSFGTLSPERSNSLLDWVETGGHLVMTASNPRLKSSRVKDPIFDHFAVNRNEHSSDELDYEALETLEPVQRLIFTDSSACDLVKANVQVSFANEEHEVKAAFPDGRYMSVAHDNASFIAGDKENSLLIQFNHGDGLITFVSNLDLWKNQLIGCNDHAYFLTRLLGNQGKIWVLFNREASGLMALLLKFVPATFLTLLIILALWLRGVSGRFGPRRQAVIEQKRDWVEHLLAIGRFYVRHDQQQHMVDAMRHRVWQRWKKAYPHLPQQGEPAIEAMASQLNLAYDQLHPILTSEAPKKLSAFLLLTQYLQTIRKQL